jgi:hypothetical protein
VTRIDDIRARLRRHAGSGSPWVADLHVLLAGYNAVHRLHAAEHYDTGPPLHSGIRCAACHQPMPCATIRALELAEGDES